MVNIARPKFEPRRAPQQHMGNIDPPPPFVPKTVILPYVWPTDGGKKREEEGGKEEKEEREGRERERKRKKEKITLGSFFFFFFFLTLWG